MVLRTERQLEAGVGPAICKTPQPITDIIHPRLVTKQPTFFLLFSFYKIIVIYVYPKPFNLLFAGHIFVLSPQGVDIHFD